MKPHELDAMLRQTLTDARLTASERSALLQVLGETRLDAQTTATYRSQVFRLARESMSDSDSRDLLGWVEDVVKLLHPVKPGGSTAAQSEALFAPFDDLPNRVTQLLHGARQSIDVCVFTITDDRLSRAILSAHQRGVRVRIISDNDKATDLGSDLEGLDQSGIDVRFDRTAAHMHHKFAVFDGAVLLNGSYNWTRSAATVNNENLVVTGDRHLVEAFGRHFEKLWALLA